MTEPQRAKDLADRTWKALADYEDQDKTGAIDPHTMEEVASCLGEWAALGDGFAAPPPDTETLVDALEGRAVRRVEKILDILEGFGGRIERLEEAVFRQNHSEGEGEGRSAAARTRKPLDIVIPPGWFGMPVNPMDDLTFRTPEGWTAWNQWTALMELLTEEERALADEQGGWAIEPIAMLRAMERMGASNG